MSKQDWVWMPHAGHFILGSHCRFRLNTYVNGYIVSTVGELWYEYDVRRLFVEGRGKYPKMEVGDDGKVREVMEMTAEERRAFLDLKGDAFDDAYFQFYGYDDIGSNRKYETMVFKAKEADKGHLCCPWKPDHSSCELDFEGYNDSESAFKGHLQICEKWDKEVHAKEYKGE